MNFSIITQTATPTASATPSPTGTATGTPTPAGTATPSATPMPTNTPSPTTTPTTTYTPTPTTAVFTNAAFIYDGDGKRVKSDITTNLGTTTTYFVGNHYEVTDGIVTKYYYAGAQRIAMRDNGTLFFLLGDHLGSTSLVTFGNGNVVSETRYKAWGEVRYASGTTPTDYTYTGQMSYTERFGLMFYNARWYDPYLNHMTQPDTIIPDPYNSQDWNRYSYVRNNPLRYTDPSGHCGKGSKPPSGTSQAQHDWLCKLRDKALEYSKLVKSEEITDAEALGMLLDFALPHYIRVARGITVLDKQALANDMGIVLGGNVFNGIVNGTGSFVSNVAAGNVNRENWRNELAQAFANQLRNSEPSDTSGTYEQYYVGFNAFGNSGFAPDLAGETGGNQVRHFAGGLSASARGLPGERAALERETPGSADYQLHLQAFQLYDTLNANLIPSIWIEDNIINPTH
jgi:RHS repeat-associated protein